MNTTNKTTLLPTLDEALNALPEGLGKILVSEFEKGQTVNEIQNGISTLINILRSMHEDTQKELIQLQTRR